MPNTHKHGSLILFGSGPGIGRAVACQFARQDFSHIILLSRNQERLQQDAYSVQQAAPEANVDIVTVDLSDLDTIRQALIEIDAILKSRSLPVEVVCFNAAGVGQSDLLQSAPDELETDFKIAVVALHAVTQWAVPHFRETMLSHPSSKPSILVTGGFLHRDPFPPLFSLSVAKAAQYNLMKTMDKVLRREGIHCGMVLVGGFVSEEAENCNPGNIARTMWDVYAQEKEHWTLEVELEDPDYKQKTAWEPYESS